MNKILIVLLVLIGVFFIYKAFPGSNAENGTSTTQSPMPAFDNTGQEEMVVVDEEAEPNDAASIDVENATVVNLEGGMFYFSPNMIKAKKGETIKVVFNNVSGIHDFVLDEFNVKTAMIKKDESVEVTFVADKVGTYEYYCSVGDHRSRGMVGTLIVEE